MYNFSHSHVIRYEINHLLIINLFIFVRGKDIASVAKTDRIIRTNNNTRNKFLISRAK
jgi:hypothetical protein